MTRHIERSVNACEGIWKLFICFCSTLGNITTKLESVNNHILLSISLRCIWLKYVYVYSGANTSQFREHRSREATSRVCRPVLTWKSRTHQSECALSQTNSLCNGVKAYVLSTLWSCFVFSEYILLMMLIYHTAVSAGHGETS